MRILIAGANGQLGRDCASVFATNHSVSGLDLPELDITSPDSIKRALERTQPDVVINCAAFTRVDDCETQRDTAYQVNAVGPGLLAQACRPSRLIHISTDYVFRGDKPAPERYSEEDATGPLGAYGATKLEGEERVLAADGRCTIVRTAWLFSATGRNFLLTMLRLAMANPKKTLRVINDQHGSPTWAHRLAEQIAVIVECGGTGIYHAVGEGPATWYELARTFLDAMGVTHFIEPCGMKDYPMPSPRPRNSILENRRLTTESLNRMGTWQSHVAGFVKAHRNELLSAAGKTS